MLSLYPILYLLTRQCNRNLRAQFRKMLAKVGRKITATADGKTCLVTPMTGDVAEVEVMYEDAAHFEFRIE